MPLGEALRDLDLRERLLRLAKEAFVLSHPRSEAFDLLALGRSRPAGSRGVVHAGKFATLDLALPAGTDAGTMVW